VNGTRAIHDTLGAALAGGGLHLLGEALELSPATRGLLAAHPDRVHLLPAADASLVGVGVGLALAGGRAVVELADPTALWGALPQLAEAAALSSRETPVRLVVRVPFGPDGAAIAPDRLLRGLPHIAVGIAGRGAECGAMLAEALAFDGPVVLLESRRALCEHEQAAGEQRVGTARLLRSGDHATLLTWGDGLPTALAAAEDLADDGIEVDVIDLRWLSPLDSDVVSTAVARTGRAVVVGATDDPLVAAVKGAFLRLESPPVRVDPTDAAAVSAAVTAAVTW